MQYITQQQGVILTDDRQSSQAFKVVIAYDDSSAVIRARDVAERLTSQLKPGIRLTSEVWKFESLRNLNLRQEAIRGGATANMIIVSVCGTSLLPTHIKMWIQDCLSERSGASGSLVALLDQEDDSFGEPPACSYLRHMAEDAGMDFFLIANSRRQERGAFARPVSRQPAYAPAMLGEFAYEENPPRREWGINE